MRGWCAIGIERGKTAENLGTLWRSAACLGATYTFTIGGRYRRTACDTVKSFRSLPHFDYPDLDAFLSVRPYSSEIVGVELTPGSVNLATFEHPRSAIYVVGPEDGSLSRATLDVCQHVVAFDSALCVNQAVAGSIVLYDRSAKRTRQS